MRLRALGLPLAFTDLGAPILERDWLSSDRLGLRDPNGGGEASCIRRIDSALRKLGRMTGGVYG